MKTRRRSAARVKPFLVLWTPRMFLALLVLTAFFGAGFACYQLIECRRLEYAIYQRVHDKAVLQRTLRHLDSKVAQEERIERVRERLEQAGVRVAPPAVPPLRVPRTSSPDAATGTMS